MKIRGLLARDLLATMVARRVLPLQRRPHLICQMGGLHDHCWLSTKNFRAGAVARNVNQISSTNMDDGGDWELGMAPYGRNHPAPLVSTSPESFSYLLKYCFYFLTSDAGSVLQLFKRLQIYRQPAADVEASDPAEIEGAWVVEPQISPSADVEGAVE
ncbi:hypothetical protein D1007_61619 [Hordeum vulgare]|nr:hypothetical protein D1007_61619 [Hordeum vulgare]